MTAPRFARYHVITLVAMAIVIAIGAVAQTADRYDSDGESQFATEGRWEMERDMGAYYLRLRTDSRSDRWTFTVEVEPKEFAGLTDGKGVEFELRREAGTFVFFGDLKTVGRGVEGKGRFGFAPSEQYVSDLRELGVHGLTDNRLFVLAAHDVTKGYVRELNALGYDRISGDRLLDLTIHEVGSDYIQGLRDIGYDVGLSELVEMRIHGVSPEVIREMNELGLTDLSGDEIVAMRIHGVSPDFVHDMRELGYPHLSMDRMVEWRIHGVTRKFIRDLNELGYTDVRSGDVVTMKIHGVTPSFIRRLHDRGMEDIPVDELIEMKIHGIHYD